jgi:hypothetical protein
MNETIERRVFGAIEFIDDLTEARVLDPLRILGPGVTLMRNHSGFHVIRDVQGHDDYTRAFDDPPANPTRTGFPMTVEDPRGRYLPQAFTLELPRRLPTPTLPAIDADNALKPVQVRLVPAAGLPLRAAWAVMRMKVVVGGSDPPVGLANVLVEATPQLAGLAVRRTLTDRHGEALVVIASAPPLLPDAGPAGLSRDFKVSLSLLLDKQVVQESTDKAWAPPDPRRIVQRRDAADADVKVVALSDQLLSAGTTRRRIEEVTWP